LCHPTCAQSVVSDSGRLPLSPCFRVIWQSGRFSRCVCSLRSTDSPPLFVFLPPPMLQRPAPIEPTRYVPPPGRCALETALCLECRPLETSTARSMLVRARRFRSLAHFSWCFRVFLLHLIYLLFGVCSLYFGAPSLFCPFVWTVRSGSRSCTFPYRARSSNTRLF
ncbi:hypothetical protein DFP72DRAFT_1093642, partial [Ephemerocybe angulata]